MTLKTKTLSVVAISLIVSIIAIACGGESTENVIATQQALNRLENTQIAASATIAAGGSIDPEGGIQVGAGSLAAQAQTAVAVTSTALALASPTPTPTEVVIEVPTDGPVLTDADSPTIQIGDQGAFTPDLITVQVGTTVLWENPRRSASSTASLDGEAEEWNSGAMSKGTFDTDPARFTHTFMVPGCHRYKSLFSGDSGEGAVCVVE